MGDVFRVDLAHLDTHLHNMSQHHRDLSDAHDTCHARITDARQGWSAGASARALTKFLDSADAWRQVCVDTQLANYCRQMSLARQTYESLDSNIFPTGDAGENSAPLSDSEGK